MKVGWWGAPSRASNPWSFQKVPQNLGLPTESANASQSTQIGIYLIIIDQPIPNKHGWHKEEVDFANNSSFDRGVNILSALPHNCDRDIRIPNRYARRDGFGNRRGVVDWGPGLLVTDLIRGSHDTCKTLKFFIWMKPDFQDPRYCNGFLLSFFHPQISLKNQTISFKSSSAVSCICDGFPTVVVYHLAPKYRANKLQPLRPSPALKCPFRFVTHSTHISI